MMCTLSSTLLFLVAITVSVAKPASLPCKILEVSVTSGDGKLIRLDCGGKMVEVDLQEGGTFSSLKVVGENKKEFLTVEYFKDSQDMFILINGEQFSAKDENSKAQEAAKFVQLLDDPEFEFFPEAVRLIHDKLALKGWESPAAMFLYRMGMAAENYHVQMKKGAYLRLMKREDVDPDTYDYHGPNPAKSCKHNGWSDSDMDNLIANQCRGVCGQTCTSCWLWVCGDCCAHTGCLRHDDFCSAGYFSSDCLTCRGVLWDTITDSPLDC